MKTYRWLVALGMLAGCSGSPAPPEGRFQAGQAVLLIGDEKGGYVFREDVDTHQADWILDGTIVPLGSSVEVIEDVRKDRLVTILVTSGPKAGLRGRVYNTFLRPITSR